MAVYAPFIRHVLQEWAGETILLALDTSQLWHRFVIVRVALVYRGRALPVGWAVLTSKSATVALEPLLLSLGTSSRFTPVVESGNSVGRPRVHGCQTDAIGT